MASKQMIIDGINLDKALLIYDLKERELKTQLELSKVVLKLDKDITNKKCQTNIEDSSETEHVATGEFDKLNES